MLWDATKAVLQKKFIAISAYIRKEGKSQINDLSSQFKSFKEEEQNKPKARRKREIVKIFKNRINEI